MRAPEMKTRSPPGSRGRAGVRISNLPPWLSLLRMVIYIKEEPAMQIRVLKTLDISNPHSIVELNVADDLDALERVQRRLLAGGVRSSMRAFGLHDAHG